MERKTFKVLTRGMLATLASLIISEIVNFTKIGGLDNPLAMSLFRLIFFCFFFLIFYFDKGSEIQPVVNLLQVLIKELQVIRKD